MANETSQDGRQSKKALGTPRFIQIGTLSERTGFPEAYLKREVRNGSIPYIEMGKRLLFCQKDVEEVLSARSLRELRDRENPRE